MKSGRTNRVIQPVMTWSVLATTLLALACADAPAGPTGAHEFDAAVTGEIQLSLSGRTTVQRLDSFQQSLRVQDPDGRHLVAIVLQEGFPSQSGHNITFARLGDSFGAGTYAVGRTYEPTSTVANPVVGTFTEFLDDGWMKLFEMGRGQLEITRISETTVQGVFTMHAEEFVVLPPGRPGVKLPKEELESGPAELTVEGSFTAAIRPQG